MQYLVTRELNIISCRRLRNGEEGEEGENSAQIVKFYATINRYTTTSPRREGPGFVLRALVSGLLADYSKFFTTCWLSPPPPRGDTPASTTSPKTLTSERLCSGQRVTRWRIINDGRCNSRSFADAAKTRSLIPTDSAKKQ